MKRVFIIAEAGVNHNANLDTALKMVDMAVDCGADAIKFQTFKAHEQVGQFADMAEYQKQNMGTAISQYEMVKALELPFEQFAEIEKYCKNKGIIFISTPDGEESLNFLLSLDVPLIKIASTEVTNPYFLKQIASTGKPIILSTGMSKLGEVEEALDLIYSTGNKNITIMHCTTDYPTDYPDVNLNAMVTLRDSFKVPVGLSDHTLGYESAIAAVALGACVIEKHITLDKNMEGPDHKASMGPEEFRQYVKSIRNTEILLGDGIKRPTAKELNTIKDVRRSIVCKADLLKGTKLDSSMFSYKRPGYGIEPKLQYLLIGKTLKKDLKQDQPISFEDIE